MLILVLTVATKRPVAHTLLVRGVFGRELGPCLETRPTIADMVPPLLHYSRPSRDGPGGGGFTLGAGIGSPAAVAPNLVLAP